MSFMTNIPSKSGSTYTPVNKAKYKGKLPCVTRSTWETKFCKWCDKNNQVLIWSSEPIGIPYFDPIKQKNRRYFPDFLVKVKDNRTEIEKIWLVEVKPYKECIPPVATKGKSKKTKIYEATTYTTNSAKWKAAIKYCKLHKWTFKIITEKELF